MHFCGNRFAYYRTRYCIGILPHNALGPHRAQLVYGYQDITRADGEDC
jgi:hypothetical protein